MIDKIKKMLGLSDQGVPDRESGFSQAHIALCALLLEAAHTDGQCSTEERDHIVATMKGLAGITADIEGLIQAADRQRRDEVDLFAFTRYLNEHCDRESKLSIMEAVWRVILIDGCLEMHEDYLAHKLANLLRLTHQELIDAKLKARQGLK